MARHFSQDTYNIFMRDMVPLEAHDDHEDAAVYRLSCAQPIAVMNVGGVSCTVIFGRVNYLMREWLQKARASGKRLDPSVSLSPFEQERGIRLARRLGIDDGTPVVVLHARDEGTWTEWTYHSYRNAHIGPYEDGIRLLAKNGYAVVRIGHPGCKPLPFSCPGVFDTPYLDSYDRIGDPYLISRCAFMMHTSSGPSTIAAAFGRPTLALNVPVDETCNSPDELVVFKEYRNAASGKAMTLAEIMRTGAIDCYTTESFAAIGCELIENDAELIRDAVAEMIERVEGRFVPAPSAARANAAFHEFGVKRDAERQRNGDKAAYRDFSYLCLGWQSIAQGFLNRYPDFLDGIEQAVPSE